MGDLAQFSIQELRESTARVQLEQQPAPQAAMIAIDNPTGEIKAMVGGYSFEDSKFNRATTTKSLKAPSPFAVLLLVRATFPQ